MKLNKSQRKEINAALADAFDYAELDRMVSLELDEALEQIAVGKNLSQIIHELIRWAERRGRLDELVAAAYRSNPQNPRVAALYANWKPSTSDSEVPVVEIHDEDRNYILLGELADEVGVHRNTILRWYKDEKVNVQAYKDYRNRWVFRRRDVAKFKKYYKQKHPVA